jgi:hypothetical protein
MFAHMQYMFGAYRLYIYIYIYKHTHVHTYIYTYIHTYIHLCIQLSMHVYVYIRVCEWLDLEDKVLYLFLQMYVCMYT